MQFDTFFFPPVPGMTNLTPGLLLLLLLKSRLLGVGGFLEVTRDSVLELQAFFFLVNPTGKDPGTGHRSQEGAGWRTL